MLRRRSVRLRILVLVLIPVFALAGLYAVVVDLTAGQLLSLRRAADVQSAIGDPTASAQDQVARERAFALQYLANPTRSNLLRQLITQEHMTDAAVRRFNAAASTVLASAGPGEKSAISVFRGQLAMLGQLRSSVVGLGLTTTDVAGSYSSIVSDGNDVLTQAILPLVTNTVAGLQAIDVVTLNSSLQAMQEESDLIRADLMARSVPVNDQQLIDQLSVQRQELWNQALPGLELTYQNYFRTMVPASAVSRIETIEIQVTTGPRPPGRTTLRQWTSSEAAYASGFREALVRSGADLQTVARKQAEGFLLRLILTGAIGLLAIALAIGVAISVARGLLRQLGSLRQSALDLASKGLPGTIARLRASEDIGSEASPPLLEASPDEIGEVRQAFNAVAQTAIAAAVEEITIRRGVNDVFRNLARRNQSLLTRQLELLDAMERRVHDPEELADLFRIDHLTTRMRRHAEGLLIVAGSSSGRTWREPVPVVDVMRAAIAEVESYTRIRVTARTSAALAGHAVADIIHLLAELVENATIFSPAHTPVRIDGDRVARGLALEIEDRGLGMSEARLAETNAMLSDPPLFDLSGSDQLGLFIAGQLARRHDIKITLRASAYGGVTAVVLVPNSLVIDVDPDDEQAIVVSIRELGGRPVPQLLGAPAEAARAAESVPSMMGAQSQGSTWGGAVQTAERAGHVTFDVSTESDVVARITGLGIPAGSGGSADTASGGPTAGNGGPPGPGEDGRPEGTRTTTVDSDPDAAELPVRGAGMSVPTWRGNGAGADDLQTGPDGRAEPAEREDLPVRVRQASLAPQLRDRNRGASPAPGRPAQPAQPAGDSPEAARRTMSAWQSGWERGRLASEQLAEEFPTSPSLPQHREDVPAADPPGREPAGTTDSLGTPSQQEGAQQ